jgi:hypothetical protein
MTESDWGALLRGLVRRHAHQLQTGFPITSLVHPVKPHMNSCSEQAQCVLHDAVNEVNNQMNQSVQAPNQS